MSFVVSTPKGPIAVHRHGTGAPLLWVHGYTLDATLWAPLWTLLPDRTHVGIDLPGHGASRRFAPDDRAGDMIDAIAAVADHAGARDVVALSLGATLCIDLAARQPRRFDRMILCAPSVAGGPVDQGAADCNQDLRRLAAERGIGPWLAARWFADPPAIFAGARRHPALFEDIRAVVTRHRWTELGSAAMTGDRRDGLAGLDAVTADILLVLGEDDMPSFARTAELLRRRLLHAAIARIAGAAHLAPLERPDLTAEAIRRHLART